MPGNSREVFTPEQMPEAALLFSTAVRLFATACSVTVMVAMPEEESVHGTIEESHLTAALCSGAERILAAESVYIEWASFR